MFKNEKEANNVIDKMLIKWYNDIYGNVRTIDKVAKLAYLDFYGEREAREVQERGKKGSDGKPLLTVEQRKNRTKKDLALIYSEKRATCASVYTTNKVKISFLCHK